jgi:superfamily I DNA and/or RNA helicase
VHDVNVEAKDICIITPYVARNEYLGTLLAREPTLTDVAIRTTDSFQGQEWCFVVGILTVTRASRPGHVVAARRLNVAATRHTDGLWVIGDVRCGQGQQKASTVIATENGAYGVAEPKQLCKFLGWFVRNDRVTDSVAARSR